MVLLMPVVIVNTTLALGSHVPVKFGLWFGLIGGRTKVTKVGSTTGLTSTETVTTLESAVPSLAV